MALAVTRLTPDDVGSKELATALRECLGGGVEGGTNPRFGDALSDVIRGIRNHGRFDLLKRFVTHGSLLPPLETRFKNTPRALSDDELAFFIDFVTNHMVTKFQGCLAEILAGREMQRLAARWKADGRVPGDAILIPGSRIRCLRRGQTAVVGQRGAVRRGIQGPDGIIASYEPQRCLVVHALIEVKSNYVAPGRLEAQFRRHVNAVRRGVRIGEEWCEAHQVTVGGSGGRGRAGVDLVLVRPASWLLTPDFHFEPTENGSRRVVMESQQLPVTKASCSREAARGWDVVTLAWSRDALRAAAFSLVHGYMAEVGEALAAEPDPDVALRTDMTPAEAGPNDLLHGLHLAIVRQQACERDAERRRKTIELYNVLAFGWTLGRGFTDDDGAPAMMYPSDLDRLARMVH